MKKFQTSSIIMHERERVVIELSILKCVILRIWEREGCGLFGFGMIESQYLNLRLSFHAYIIYPGWNANFASLKKIFRTRLDYDDLLYLLDSQTSFFKQIFIKNMSYNTIHIFKNYFTIALMEHSSDTFKIQTIMIVLTKQNAWAHELSVIIS